MNEHAKKQFMINMRLMKSNLRCIADEKLRTDEAIKSQVSVMEKLIEDCEKLVLEK